MLLIQQSLLLRLLPVFLLVVPLCVNLARERVLKLKRPKVHKEDLNGHKCSGWSPIEEARSQETHRASPVHRRASDVERKPGHRLVHKDPKIVAEEGAGYA